LRIDILYFSSLKDKVKKNKETVDVDPDTNLNQLIQFLKQKHPEISQNLDNVMVAVNEQYVDKNYSLKEGDIVALIPPVSGG